MSKADEMFEKLGYEIDKNKNEITYINLTSDEFIELTDYPNYGKMIKYSKYEGITMQELQAINEKVKELGWNE